MSKASVNAEIMGNGEDLGVICYYNASKYNTFKTV